MDNFCSKSCRSRTKNILWSPGEEFLLSDLSGGRVDEEGGEDEVRGEGDEVGRLAQGLQA